MKWLIRGFIVAAILGGAYMALPRGIRNNNPGNIRGSSAFIWDGEIGRDKDDFVKYEGAEWGFRAMAKLLVNYQEKHGLETIYQLIARYAPSTENNTDAYARHVAEAAGVDPHQVVDLRRDTELLADVLAAMAKHENGINPFGRDVIGLGIELAGFA